MRMYNFSYVACQELMKFSKVDSCICGYIKWFCISSPVLLHKQSKEIYLYSLVYLLCLAGAVKQLVGKHNNIDLLIDTA